MIHGILILVYGSYGSYDSYGSDEKARDLVLRVYEGRGVVRSWVNFIDEYHDM